MNQKIKDLLLSVDKPSRYCGGEFNTPEIKGNPDLRFLMCFPDVYELAHSNLGIKILYYMLNARDDVACETCYAPWADMAEALSSHGLTLMSQETHRPMAEFGIIGFSMQYEMSYTNVLYMLEKGGIGLLRKDRADSDPLIVAGGPCVINPMPLTDFIDVFSIGDGEKAINELADAYILNKRQGGSRHDLLLLASKIDGMYVPGISKRARRAVIDDLDTAFYPTKVQIPNIEAVHNRSVLEIFRGCTRGCRFCQAGMLYRPVRERSPETLLKYARELIDNNGFDEISLSSLSTCDYPYLKDLLKQLKPVCDESKVTISLPSTRVDSFEAEFVASSRLSSITFAPEAGTQRLRDVINKNVTEGDIFTSLKYAFERGYSAVKLYFMIGLPTETDEDIDGIIELAAKIKDFYRKVCVSKKPLSISLSTSTFVPKPFTPFQWEPQITQKEIEEKQNKLKNALRPMRIKYNWHDSHTSHIEACLARGDQKMGEVILRAYRLGCKFDSWGEFFDYDKWLAAFDAAGVNPQVYSGRQPQDKPLPWEIIESGISRQFLLSELDKAYGAQLTADCRNGCHGCGIQKEYPSAFAKNCAKGSKKV